MRLLYKTTCRACGDDIAAGTATWWDDDRRHATCTGCFAEGETDLLRTPADAVTATSEVLHRRRQVIRSRQARPARPAPRRTGGLGGGRLLRTPADA